MPALSLAEANRIVEGAITKAEELNIKIAAAVCDAGGHLLAFSRMDGAIWAAAYGPPGKAVSSAAFGRPSGAINLESPTIRAIVAGQRYMILGQGGLPIIRGGEVVGACGAGGGTGQQDEDCARAGIEKL